MIKYIGNIKNNYTIDFDKSYIQILSVSADIKFGVKNFENDKESKEIRIFINAIGNRNLTFDPGIKWISKVPNKILDGQIGYINFFTKGKNIEDVIAEYVVIGSYKPNSPYIAYWGYQDFSAITGLNITLTKNENADIPETDLTDIVNNSAVITDLNGKGVYTGSIKLFSNLISVSSHLGTAVALDKIPHSSYSPFRIWFLIKGTQPDGALNSPDFVTKKRVEFMEEVFVNQFGDTMAGILNMNFNQLINLPDPSTNGEPVRYGNAENVFFYDTNRGKKLSVNYMNILFAGRNNSTSSNIYLRDKNGITMNQSGYILKKNATLVSIVGWNKSGINSTWIGEVRKNGSFIITSSINIINTDSAIDNTIDVDYNAGDEIQIYMNGSNINRPKVLCFFRERV